MNDEYLTPKEVANLLRVHRVTVQKMIENGQLPGSIALGNKTRKHWRIPKSALEELKKGAVPIDLQPIEQSDLVRNPYSHLRRFMKKQSS